MNTKIFNLINENLQQAFNLEKYQTVRENITVDTEINKLPWTPARFRKFKESVEKEIQLPCEFDGTIKDIVADLDRRYLNRFFGEIWKPRTETFGYTGWGICDEINKLNPKSVLDVGCGYNQFKERIQNLVGIDPYNNSADYQVDILDYKVKPGSHDVVMAFGSINFNSRDEIEARFSHCVDLLEKGGKFFLRANPGIQHVKGPYVDVFAWSFEVVNELAEKYNLHLDTFKQDNNGRLYFVYTKL